MIQNFGIQKYMTQNWSCIIWNKTAFEPDISLQCKLLLHLYIELDREFIENCIEWKFKLHIQNQRQVFNWYWSSVYTTQYKLRGAMHQWTQSFADWRDCWMNLRHWFVFRNCIFASMTFYQSIYMRIFESSINRFTYFFQEEEYSPWRRI